MALSNKMQDEINKQINFELHSAYIYAAMSADLMAKNLPGCAIWMRQQAHEEIFHAMKFNDFVLARDGQVKLLTIEAPPSTWESALAAFQGAYEHEQKVTARLNALLEVALAEKDHPAQNVVRWFIDEQVEEEATLNELVHQFKLVGKDGGGLYMLDRELANRPAPTPPGAAKA